eukprot:GEMP01059888.1.p1 GENE.GEMP01059888.1~~GEMP01059888.1.p1  ORF type:complete len:311 (+),score=70.28 GEMP01059888.1:101-1033(+)
MMPALGPTRVYLSPFSLGVTEQCNWTDESQANNLFAHNDIDGRLMLKAGGWQPFQSSLIKQYKKLVGRKTKLFFVGKFLDGNHNEVVCDDVAKKNCWMEGRMLKDRSCTLKDHCLHGEFADGHPAYPYFCPSWVARPFDEVPCTPPNGWDACPMKFTLAHGNEVNGGHSFAHFLDKFNKNVHCDEYRQRFCKKDGVNVDRASLGGNPSDGKAAPPGIYFHAKNNKWFACDEGLQCKQIHVAKVLTGKPAEAKCNDCVGGGSQCLVMDNGDTHCVAKEFLFVVSPYETDALTAENMSPAAAAAASVEKLKE